MALIEIDRDDLEIDGRMRAQVDENVEHRVTVLAAGQTDHYAIAGADHAVVADRLPDQPAQTLGELVGFVERFLIEVGSVHAESGS